MASAATQEARRAPRSARRIISVSFGLVILLIIQYVLGIGYNLYGTMPTVSRKVGLSPASCSRCT
ncbi:MAG: hypothetical protein M3Z75_11385 [Actinomycetota bacterium]|nr:hypothetical protein [Actinomycetota bacterium]